MFNTRANNRLCKRNDKCEAIYRAFPYGIIYIEIHTEESICRIHIHESMKFIQGNLYVEFIQKNL